MNEHDERPEPAEPPDLHAVRIAVTRESLPEVLATFALDVGDRPMVEPQPDGTGVLLAFASDDQVRRLEEAGYRVEVGENLSEVGRRRQAEVGTGDRFEGGRVAPRGLGIKRGGEAKETAE